jgi:hypothetical protein
MRGRWLPARCGSSRARARRCSCPTPISGLIVVDEEHEGAYKQEDGVFYHARDMAVVRGHIEKFPVVLASATPSIESRVNAAQGRYAICACPSASAGAPCPTSGPSICARAAGARRWISPRLRQAVERDAGARRAGAALPQPARLCAADAVPRPAATASSARTARPGSSSTASALPRLPPLRPYRAKPEACPPAARRFAGRLRAGRRAHRGGGRRAFSRGQAHHHPVERHARRHGAAAPGTRGDRKGGASSTSSSARSSSPRGTTFPDDAGRRARRRYRPRLRRSARGRAHLPAALQQVTGRAGRFGESPGGR